MWYHLGMSKFDELIIKMRTNPRDYRQPGTSHVTFRLVNGSKVTVPAHKAF